MRSARSVFVVSAAMLMISAAWPRAAQRGTDPTVAQLVALAGRYVAGYEAGFGVVVAAEQYQQSMNGPVIVGANRRLTTGDVLMFNSGGAGWMTFRDVQTMEGKPLPSVPGRLAALAATPTHDSLVEAMRADIVASSYTIGTVPRTSTIPTTALTYLRTSRQPFGSFELEGFKALGDVRVAIVKFAERSRAHMADVNDFVTTGRFWIEPESGRVMQTELTIASDVWTSKTEVQYATRPGVDFLVPVRSFERLNVSVPLRSAGLGRGGMAVTSYVDGLATYQSFRRFDLQPDLIVK